MPFEDQECFPPKETDDQSKLQTKQYDKPDSNTYDLDIMSIPGQYILRFLNANFDGMRMKKESWSTLGLIRILKRNKKECWPTHGMIRILKKRNTKESGPTRGMIRILRK